MVKCYFLLRALNTYESKVLTISLVISEISYVFFLNQIWKRVLKTIPRMPGTNLLNHYPQISLILIYVIEASV